MIVDSQCVTSWHARPVSFVSLMTLYESNYIRLRRLAGDVRMLSGRLLSSAPRECDLHLTVVEHSRYTSILRLTYLFQDASGPVADRTWSCACTTTPGWPRRAAAAVG